MMLIVQQQQSYFHDFCLIDYNNATSIKECWEGTSSFPQASLWFLTADHRCPGDNTVSLPDLRTEDTDVSDVWNSWITALVETYSIDGLRVDSAQQVDNAFFPPFETAGMLARTYSVVTNATD